MFAAAVVGAYSLCGGLFRLRCEELATAEEKWRWLVTTASRVALCGGVLLVRDTFAMRAAVVCCGCLATYLHNGRGRPPTA